MPNYRGILSFPNLFTPKPPKGSNNPRFDLALLLEPGEELNRAYADFVAIRDAAYPSGVPNSADVCMMPYDEKYKGKDYYDPRCSGWWVITATAQPDSRPAVVDESVQQIIDPGQIYSGLEVIVNMNMSAYSKGTGGIGGWLNGVMSLGKPGKLGRLDNKPTAEQMFAAYANVPPHAGGPGAPVAPPAVPTAPAAAPVPVAAPPAVPTAPAAPVPPAPPTPPAAPAAPARQMTAAAQYTYEQYKASGWTDLQLVEAGLMVAPVQTSFA